MKACLATIVLLASASCAVFTPDRFGYKYRDGPSEAREDLATGVRKIKVYGLDEEAWVPEYSKEARATFGVEFDVIALCAVDRFLLAYADGYNAVVEDRLNKIYGRDVLTELRDSVRARYKEEKRANQALEPTPTAVTSAAEQPPRRP